MRVLFLGMFGQFSLIPLKALLASGMEVCAIIVPAERGEGGPAINRLVAPSSVSRLPLANPFIEPNVMHLGWQHDIPVYAMADAGAELTRQTVSSLAPEIACVACFPSILPTNLLSAVSHGFLNLHPSLLPAYRGPAPLFWVFRQGEMETGVTVHFMDEGADSGDILLQAVVPLPEGISGTEAEHRCAQEGGRLLVEAVRQLEVGTAMRLAQGAGGSYFPWPNADDFHIPVSWTAQRAYNFMRGTAEWGIPYRVALPGGEVALAASVAYRPEGEQGELLIIDGDFAWIQFSHGLLQAAMIPGSYQEAENGIPGLT